MPCGVTSPRADVIPGVTWPPRAVKASGSKCPGGSARGVGLPPHSCRGGGHFWHQLSPRKGKSPPWANGSTPPWKKGNPSPWANAPPLRALAPEGLMLPPPPRGATMGAPSAGPRPATGAAHPPPPAYDAKSPATVFPRLRRAPASCGQLRARPRGWRGRCADRARARTAARTQRHRRPAPAPPRPAGPLGAPAGPGP